MEAGVDQEHDAHVPVTAATCSLHPAAAAAAVLVGIANFAAAAFAYPVLYYDVRRMLSMCCVSRLCLTFSCSDSISWIDLWDRKFAFFTRFIFRTILATITK